MSSMRPLISILLLCYNQQDFVGEAIEGVLSQTYSPLEILILIHRITSKMQRLRQ